MSGRRPPQPRALAAKALIRVERGGYANLVLAGLLRESGLSARDRAFASRLTYGTLERLRTLDARLTPFLKKPIRRIDPEVRTALRLGLYQMLYMDAVPDAAAVSESVKLTRSLGKSSAAGMVNAVLRRAAGEWHPGFADETERLGVRYSVSDPVAKLLLDSWGARAEQILAASFETPPMTIRVNTLRTDAEGLSARLSQEGVRTEQTLLRDALVLHGAGEITALPSFGEGLFHVQGLASQMAVTALAPEPGQRVLDLCAAPGGKSATIAQWMNNSGTLYSCDAAESRLPLIRSLFERLGIRCGEVLCRDGTRREPAFAEMDRVLCDVPCSGLGVLAKKPDIRYKDLADLPKLIQTQREILENGALALRAGGRLVYSTCTINPEENEGVVLDFLARHPAFRLMRTLPESWTQGAQEHNGMITFLPDTTQTDGFFVATLERLW